MESPKKTLARLSRPRPSSRVPVSPPGSSAPTRPIDLPQETVSRSGALFRQLMQTHDRVRPRSLE